MFIFRQRIKSTNWKYKKTVTKLAKSCEFNKTIKKKPTLKKHNKSDLINNSNYSLYKYFVIIKKR